QRSAPASNSRSASPQPGLRLSPAAILRETRADSPCLPNSRRAMRMPPAGKARRAGRPRMALMVADRLGQEPRPRSPPADAADAGGKVRAVATAGKIRQSAKSALVDFGFISQLLIGFE